MTKSEFRFSMIPPSWRSRNVPDLDPGRVNCQTRAGVPRARAMHKFFSRKFTKSRAREPRAWGAMRWLPTGQVYSTKFSTNFSTRVYRVHSDNHADNLQILPVPLCVHPCVYSRNLSCTKFKFTGSIFSMFLKTRCKCLGHTTSTVALYNTAVY
jgi:hypothetical protein